MHVYVRSCWWVSCHAWLMTVYPSKGSTQQISSDGDQPAPPSVAGFITWPPAIFIHLFCTCKYHCFADLIIQYDKDLDYQFLSTSTSSTQDVLTWRKILKINESTVILNCIQRQDGSLRLFLSYSANFDWKRSAPKPAGSGYHWTLQEVILRGTPRPTETTVVWSTSTRSWHADWAIEVWRLAMGFARVERRAKKVAVFPGVVWVAHWMTSEWKWRFIDVYCVGKKILEKHGKT